jgi:hypothetical protein
MVVTGPRLISSLSLFLLLAATACDSTQGRDEVADLTITPASTTLVLGDSVQLTATARSSDVRVLSLDRSRQTIRRRSARITMDADDGGNVVLLVPGEDPAWSPSGTVIAPVTCQSVCDLHHTTLSVIQPDGERPDDNHRPVRLPPAGLVGRVEAGGTRYSHQGGRRRRRQLRVTLNPDGTGFQLLTGPADHLPS